MIEPRRRIPACVVTEDREFRERVCAAIARSARFRFEVGAPAPRGLAVVDERSASGLGAAAARMIVVRARPEAHPLLVLALAERAAREGSSGASGIASSAVPVCAPRRVEATSANRTRDLLFTRQLLYRLS